jgi:predicted small secreted protein
MKRIILAVLVIAALFATSCRTQNGCQATRGYVGYGHR